jgi:hypothetical protein
MIEVAPEVLGKWIYGLITMFSLYVPAAALCAVLALLSWLGSLQAERRFFLFMSGMLFALALFCAALFAGTITLVAPLMTDIQRLGGGCITTILLGLSIGLVHLCTVTCRRNQASV